MRRNLMQLIWKPACFLAAGLVLAGAGKTGSDIDTDGDGRYSLVELRAYYPALSEADFRRIDLDGDGRISPGEFRAAQDDGLLVLASAPASTIAQGDRR